MRSSLGSDDPAKEKDASAQGAQIDPLLDKYISPEKLKDIFDKMTEIETNPESRSAKDFEAKVTELSKNSPEKR